MKATIKPKHKASTAKKKPAKHDPEQEEVQRQSPLKRLIFGEEKPDLSELEAGATTILDILSPTVVDTKSREYIVVDGVFHAYAAAYAEKKHIRINYT